jgi:hypothetical protein
MNVLGLTKPVYFFAMMAENKVCQANTDFRYHGKKSTGAC